MSVQTQISRITAAVGAAYDAVEAKGGTDSAAQTIEGLAGAISGIKSAPTGPYMDVLEYVEETDTDGNAAHYIKRAKLYNHTRISAHEFDGQADLQELDCSDPSNNITAIESMAFGNANAAGLVLPNTITHLGNACFSSAIITTLTIPSLVTELPVGGFQYAQPLVDFDTGEETPINIIFPPNLTKIGQYCFEGTPLQQVTIPNTVMEIGERAFCYNQRLESITLSTRMTKIPDAMLYGCSNLTTITIPTLIEEIGVEAFRDTGIRSIKFPVAVKSIGTRAFSQSEAMETITCLAMSPPKLGAQVFTVDSNTVIKVPPFAVARYKAAANWSSYADQIVGV